MNKAFEEILGRLEELRETYDEMAFIEMNTNGHTLDFEYAKGKKDVMLDVKKIVQEVAEEFATDTNVGTSGWILCSEKMPPVETEVFIVAKRKYCGGEVKYITTTAMYEDGTVLENDSSWRWEDIEGEWDEENDCYIIPEGWWENRHYNPDDVYNNAVDDEVVAWQPLPKPFKERD